MTSEPGLARLVEVLRAARAAHEWPVETDDGLDYSLCTCGAKPPYSPGGSGDAPWLADHHDAHLARAVQAHVKGRVEAAAVEALHEAAQAVRGVDYEHHTAFGSLHKHPTFVINEVAELLEGAAQATSGDLTASAPDGGREGVRGGEGAWVGIHHGVCPECREVTFIGHGPLCTDCYLGKRTNEEKP